MYIDPKYNSKDVKLPEIMSKDDDDLSPVDKRREKIILAFCFVSIFYFFFKVIITG